MAERSVARRFRGQAAIDGAGVRLTRIFGFGDTELLDPFLLLDAFGSDDEEEYLPGFPMHPHRGIETVTYMLEGRVRHGDSMGNSGIIGPGDLQWMTAGSGIVHEEMPQRSPGGVHGFQLWVNLPRSEKMCDPRYRGIEAREVPRAALDGGEALVLAGRFGGVEGPVKGIVRDPTYLDLRLGPGGTVSLDAPRGETAFAYVYEGDLERAGSGGGGGAAGNCLLFGDGDDLRLVAGGGGARLIFARGAPLRESVAWRGPIVMNTRAELDLAFREYQEGGFVKKRA